MAFTSAATAILLSYDKAVDYKLELATFFSGSSSFTEYAYVDFSVERVEDGAATASFVLTNDSFTYSDEADQSNRTQLRGLARLTARVGSETKVVFDGIITDVIPVDAQFRIQCADWAYILNETLCEVSLVPTEIEICDESPRVEIFAISGTPDVWGFAVGTTPTAFDDATGTRRRSWARMNTRLWTNATDTINTTTDPDSTYEVAPQHFRIDYTSGSITILEGTPAAQYWVSTVNCYKESAAAGATNVDWARVFQQMLTYAAAKYGPGYTYASDCDFVDTGSDCDGALYFYGKCSDLLEDFRQKQQANIKLVWDSSQSKWKLRLITQNSGALAAYPTQPYALIHPMSIDQTRGDHDVYTAIDVKGQNVRPINQVKVAFDAGLLTSIVTATTDFFGWNGTDIGANTTFAAVDQYLVDGDANMGAAVHNLVGTSADVDPGATKYDGWWYFIKVDLGSVQQIQRIRAWMPGSRNPNVANQGIFWPGLRVQVSEDDITYYDASPLLFGHYEPFSKREASFAEIVRPKARYVRVLCGAYKEGYSNQSDPCIGLNEFEIYTDEEYRIQKSISPLMPITAASTVTDKVEFDGDYTADWAAGDTFTITGSTGNDGNYTVVAVTFDGTRTELQVAALPSSTADGYLYSTTDYTYSNGTAVQRDYPDLWVRFGRRFKTRSLDLGNQYNQQTAGDVALQLLAESLRLFQSVTYVSVSDPRVDIYDTVAVTDDLNGDITSILVTGVVLTPKQTTIRGTNFLASALP